MKEVISGIRTIRKDKNIPSRDAIELYIIPGEKGYVPEYGEVVCKLGNVSKLELSTEEITGAANFMVWSSAYYIPFEGNVDVEAEVAKINEELAYFGRFLDTVLKKLGNEKFVASAPAKVVEIERKKQADAVEKLKILEDRLSTLK